MLQETEPWGSGKGWDRAYTNCSFLFQHVLDGDLRTVEGIIPRDVIGRPTPLLRCW